MSGALLSEVWPDMVQKPKKTKRLKKKRTNDPLDPPLIPDEMETELLDDRTNDELDPRRRLRGMRVSPYTDNETEYQNTTRKVDLDFNNNIVRADMMRNIKREANLSDVSDVSDDPDYQDFLEFKRMKMNKLKQSKYLGSSNEEQFNELLLYVFTGFFLLMIYDNIYKLGRDSFY